MLLPPVTDMSRLYLYHELENEWNPKIQNNGEISLSGYEDFMFGNCDINDPKFSDSVYIPRRNETSYDNAK